MKYLGLAGLLLCLEAQAVQTINMQQVDVRKAHDEEVVREVKGEAPRFAVPNEMMIAPLAEKAQWEQDGDNMVWKRRVVSKNSVSLNFGFEQFRLPEGAKLEIYASDFSSHIRPFTAADNNAAEQLWTPVIYADDVMIEVTVPMAKMDEVKLELTSINQGFRTFTQKTEKAGSCNVDVACSEGDDWRNEINAVAVISTGGSTFCTGFMVNNTANDMTPYFMTANHCRVNTSRAAASLVTYWNYQASECGGSRNGRQTQFNTGAQYLASYSASDFAIVKLNQAPNPEWGVTYAGWDRSGEIASMAVAIHHPSTDEKSISFEFDPTTNTKYLKEEEVEDATHVRVTDWDVGTTEPGSSGSPLFDQNHRVIGQLHGGYASCSSQTSDWYGRIYTSWEGGGSASTRLKDHLDAAGTGAMFVDTLVPGADAPVEEPVEPPADDNGVTLSSI